jgi:hypothetical protein
MNNYYFEFYSSSYPDNLRAFYNRVFFFDAILFCCSIVVTTVMFGEKLMLHADCFVTPTNLVEKIHFIANMARELIEIGTIFGHFSCNIFYYN